MIYWLMNKAYRGGRDKKGCTEKKSSDTKLYQVAVGQIFITKLVAKDVAKVSNAA